MLHKTEITFNLHLYPPIIINIDAFNHSKSLTKEVKCTLMSHPLNLKENMSNERPIIHTKCLTSQSFSIMIKSRRGTKLQIGRANFHRLQVRCLLHTPYVIRLCKTKAKRQYKCKKNSY
jgi:hypothetical protein